jgi:2-methylcitrate dehydratase PrpD
VLLSAVVSGYEIGGRLGAVCRIRPGMHVDGTWGSFGAAAACCRLFGVAAPVALSALNHAACHLPFSLYWPIASGSTARNAYAGHGAAHGLASTLAAMAGLRGPPGSIGEMMRRALDRVPEKLLPPGRVLLLEGYLKPYPAVRHVHYGVRAAEAWRGGPAGIGAIRLAIYEEAITYCGNRAPRTAIQAQFSLSYGVARTLAYGTLDPAAYTEDALADPLVQRLEGLVQLVPDPAAQGRSCTLEVDGWRQHVDRVPGDPDLKLTRDEVRAKFLAYAGPVIGMQHATAIAARVLDGGLDTPLDLQD